MPPFEAVVPRAANAHCRVQYRLLAEAEADLLCRALNLFALQGLTPEQVHVERHSDLLTMEILIEGLSWHRAQVLAEKLRNLISVCSVDLQRADIAWPAPVQATA